MRGADGDCDAAERAVLQRLADEVGVGAASLTAMIERAESDPGFYKQQFRMLSCDPPYTMAVLLEAAMADGDVGDSELQMMKELSHTLGVPEAVFDQLTAMARTLTNE